jgi:hypothetical protein
VSARPAGWRVAALGAVLALGGAWHAVLILVFLAAALWAEEVARALIRAAGAVRGRARQRRRELDLRRLALQGLPVTAPCAHRQAVPVRGLSGDDVVAWLCPQCDTQLPAEFSASGENR